jgi:hypothetical protein
MKLRWWVWQNQEEGFRKTAMEMGKFEGIVMFWSQISPQITGIATD